MKKISLSEALGGIEDTRREQSVMYPLIEIFGKSKKKWLKKFMRLEYGIPDACTLRNVIKEIDAKKLHEIFAEWMKEIARVFCMQ